MTTAKNPFMPHRDHRFEYSTEAVAFIERTNCAKGCLEPRTIEDPNEPGGNCELIVTVAIGEPKAIPELHDGGHYIKCLRRTPPPKEEPQPFDQGPDLFQASNA